MSPRETSSGRNSGTGCLSGPSEGNDEAPLGCDHRLREWLSLCQSPGQCPSGLYPECAGGRGVPCRKSLKGCAPAKESLLIDLLNPLYGVKPGLGSGWAGLVSAPPAHTPQHSEISVEAFKSRTFPQKTFCNISSVLWKQKCSLEELSPARSCLQSGTLPPCCGDRAL